MAAVGFSPPTHQHRMFYCYYSQLAMMNLTENTQRWSPKNVHILSLTDEGQNVFKIVSLSKTHLVAHNINVDKHGQKTELTGLFGMCDILLCTSTLSCRTSIINALIRKIIMWWWYLLCSPRNLDLSVRGDKDPGTKSTKKEELRGVEEIISSDISK